MTLRRRALAGGVMLAALLGPSTAAAAAGRLDIVVAIDFGGGRPPVETCVSVPAGASGSDALAAALDRLQLSRAVYAASGLLCSIGGVPGPGECGRRDAAGYHYWAYFHGGPAGWTYASNGPAANRASEASAEGWRFQAAGTGRPGDPPPRLAATDRSACVALRQVAASAPSTSTTTPQVPVASTSTTKPTEPAATTSTTHPVLEPRSISVERSAARQSPSQGGGGAVLASAAAATALFVAGAALALRHRRRRR